jgi:hypothetical protein
MSERILTDTAHANDGFAISLLRYFNPVGAHESGRANCSLTKHSRDGNKLAERGNEILEYSWYKSGQSPPAGKDKVKNLFNY